MSETPEEQPDRLALTQALLEAELSAARVADLTERLTESRDQVIALRSELERLRMEYQQLQTEQEQMRNSAAFRLADRIWTFRNKVGF